MADIKRCVDCGSVVESEGSACPDCGGRLDDATASLPVVGDRAEEARQDYSDLEGPALVVRKGPEVGDRFYLDRPRLSIGRDPSSDIFLNDVTVSRKHAELTVDAGVVRVHDAGSLNGTYVNGLCVDEAELSDGDSLQIGTFQMSFVGGGR